MHAAQVIGARRVFRVMTSALLSLQGLSAEAAIHELAQRRSTAEGRPLLVELVPYRASPGSQRGQQLLRLRSAAPRGFE
jgi:hypothetical protein